jgi:hypothetical protein
MAVRERERDRSDVLVSAESESQNLLTFRERPMQTVRKGGVGSPFGAFPTPTCGSW